MSKHFKNIFCIFFITSISITACRKGELSSAEKIFGSVKAELLNLPGTPEMDFYADGIFQDSLQPGIPIPYKLLRSNEDIRMTFTKHGSQEVLMDTIMQLPRETKSLLRVAYSTDLNMKKFLNGGGTVHPDSTELFFFDDLTSLQPDDLQIKAEIHREDVLGSGIFSLHHDLGLISKKTMVGNSFMISINNEDDNPFQYRVYFRNATTGEFINDEVGFLFASLGFVNPDDKGKSIIVTLYQMVSRGKQRFGAKNATL